ncbi:hypothetical protein GGF46_003952 [Coemansia sp. RSA 552]|nr:hypothetical protein GGF46_003952 [Coemansia sp. RSA 552]
MVESDDTRMMAPLPRSSSVVSTVRHSAVNAAQADGSGAGSKPSMPGPRNGNNNKNNNRRQQQQQQQPHQGSGKTPRKGNGRNKDPASSQKHARQPRGKAKDNEDSDAEPGAMTPTKKSRSGRRGPKKVELLTKNISEADQESLLARFAAPDEGSPAASRRSRNRRRQPSPPSLDDQPQLRTPTRRPASERPARPMSNPGVGTVFSPTPRQGTARHPASTPGGVQRTGGSPAPPGSARSSHYAGASFNNSPLPSTLPLPPAFLTTPTKQQRPAGATANNNNSGTRTRLMRDEDVFTAMPGAPSMSPDQIRLQFASPPGYQHHMQVPERMGGMSPFYAGLGHHSYSSVDLPQQDLPSMFQKLHMAMDFSQTRPASIGPAGNASPTRNPHLAPVYYA